MRPTLFPRFRVEGDHAVERRRNVQRAAHQEWRGFKAAPLSRAPSVRDVPGVKHPGDFEPRDIVTIDLGQR